MIWSFVEPIIKQTQCITNLHMRLFFLTHSVVGSIDDQILILTNRQVVLMGLGDAGNVVILIGPLIWMDSPRNIFLVKVDLITCDQAFRVSRWWKLIVRYVLFGFVKQNNLTMISTMIQKCSYLRKFNNCSLDTHKTSLEIQFITSDIWCCICFKLTFWNIWLSTFKLSGHETKYYK